MDESALNDLHNFAIGAIDAPLGSSASQAVYEIERLRAENKRLRADLQLMVGAFRHTHLADYTDDGVLTDTCGRCGLDLRNPVHFAAREEE